MPLRAALFFCFAALTVPLFGREWIAAHYPTYQRALLPPDQIDYTKFSQLIFFQISPGANGTIDTSDVDATLPDGSSEAALLRDHVHTAGGRMLVCVGGDGTYATFSKDISDPYREAFASALVSWVVANQYDGLDVDLEPVQDGDAVNFCKFATLLRDKLDAQVTYLSGGQKALLTGDFYADATMAEIFTRLVDNGAGGTARGTDYFDEVNVMTYDLTGPYQGSATAHDSAVYPSAAKNADGSDFLSANEAVGYYEADGRVNAARLGVGASSNGQRWFPATRLGQSAQGLHKVEVPYRDVMNRWFSFARYHYDDVAEAAYLLVPAAPGQPANFLSFPDARASADKVRYVRGQSLGGLMVWDISSQYLNGQFPLLTAMNDALDDTSAQSGLTVTLAPEGSLTSEQSVVDAGAAPLGQSATVSFTVHNGSTTTLHDLAANFTTGRAGDFAVVAPLPATLSSGQDATLSVRFTAAVRGLATTLLSVTSSDPATPSFNLGLRASGLTLPDAAGVYLGYSPVEKALLNLTVTAGARTSTGTISGIFTGTIVQGGLARPVHGTITPGGALSATLGSPGLLANLQLRSSGPGTHPGGFSITGSLGGDAAFTAWHTAYTPGVPLASQGTYTFTLASAAGSPAGAPAGTGYASVTITASGAARVAGALADGTPLTAGTVVVGGGSDGNNQLLVDLAPRTGTYALIGAIDLAGAKTGASSAALQWSKASTGAAAGFQTQLVATGHLWVPPAAGVPALTFSNSAAQMSFSGAGLEPDFSENIVIPKVTTAPTIRFPLANPASATHLAATLNRLTGLITGSFIDAGTGATLHFGAAALQTSPPSAAGYFLGPVSASGRSSGQVLLQAQP